MIPRDLEQLREQLERLPGIGAKSAMRLTLYFLETSAETVTTLLNAVSQARNHIHACPICHAYRDAPCCPSCTRPYDESGILCVVESALDVFALQDHLPEGAKFHCLGGKLSPLSGITPEHLHLDTLKKRLGENGLKEVILATGSDIEGEATAKYIAGLLNRHQVRVSRIAFGVTVGGALSGADSRSIQKSLEGRADF